MTSKKLSLILHSLAFLASNAAIVAFVPAGYQELVGIAANALVALSAFYDKTHALNQ